MSKEQFKVSDNAIQLSISEMMKRLGDETPESIYNNAMLDVLQENLKNRPIGRSEFGPDGSQTLRVCGGL